MHELHLLPSAGCARYSVGVEANPVLVPCPRHMSVMPGGGAASGDAREAARVDASVARAQGYRLVVDANGITLVGHDEPGLFYGRQTLAQLRTQFPDGIPAIEIEDWPDLPVRGLMVDVSRDKVPTMGTLRGIVDLCASLKLNQLQLYTEHTFAYARHREVWEHASPITPDEVRELDAYCRERFVELVPNQNSFGHMERWLRHPRYAPLAEKPDGFTFPWGTRHDGGFSLNPLDARSLELVEGLYDELLPNFTSRLFNVGCDETFDLGLGKSKDECERRGKERVYLDFLLKIHHAVRRRGRTMQFWGDIILHKPELIPDLPKDVIALNWGYEYDHPFETETKAFADAGVPFYVCPGTSSWLSITGRTDVAIGNLKNAAENALAHGAAGYLITDWGDFGHLQYWPVSYLGIAAGAAYAWCYESNRDMNVAEGLDVHVFRDAGHVMGRLMHDLGNVYRLVGPRQQMSSRLFWTLAGPPAERLRLYEMVTTEEYDAAEAALDDAVRLLEAARMDRPDAELIADEVRNAAAMLRHGCRRGRRRLGTEKLSDAEMAEDLKRIIAEHRRLWLARNRPGGLSDSARRLEDRLADYRSNIVD